MTTPGTQATSVYQRLRRELLMGLFPPGAKLRIEGLCARYGTGATPVREALNRLSAEDLVTREDQRGCRVAPVSLDELEELTKTHCWISEIGLREAIRNGDAEWEDAIVLAAHRLSRLPRLGPSGYGSYDPEWEVQHRELHLALIAACGSRWLRDFYALLLDRGDRYRYLSASHAGPARDPAGEHRALVEAVLARDAERAVALANAHIRLTAENVARSQAPALAAAMR
jgi:DNA-binding GntR family transcriptional regulator